VNGLSRTASGSFSRNRSDRKESEGAPPFPASRLDSRHTFSFGDYYDPQRLGFRDLRVINEDRVGRGAGFSTHSRRDMEIIT